MDKSEDEEEGEVSAVPSSAYWEEETEEEETKQQVVAVVEPPIAHPEVIPGEVSDSPRKSIAPGRKSIAQPRSKSIAQGLEPTGTENPIPPVEVAHPENVSVTPANHLSELPGESAPPTAEIPGETAIPPEIALQEIPSRAESEMEGEGGEEFFLPVIPAETPGTGTSPFEVTTTDAEGDTKHFNSEDTTIESGAIVTAAPTTVAMQEEEEGEIDAYEENEMEEIPPSQEAEMPTTNEEYADDIGEFVIPPEETYYNDVEDDDEETGEEFPTFPHYELPPDEPPLTDDDLVLKYLYHPEEMAGEDYNLPVLSPERELSALSVHSLDEMIRLLQGDAGQPPVEIQKVNPSTLQEESVEPSSAVQLEHKPHDEDQLMVLGPNHPKMQRFQEALRQHLEKQMYETTCETRDAEHELKVLRQEREETGQHLYNLQFELARQAEHLNKLESQLDHLQKQRIEHETSGKVFEGELAVARANLMKELDIESEMIQAIKEMDMLEWCIRQTDEEYEGEAKIQEQLDDQFQREKIRTEMEKRNQDFYLDKVMTNVQRMEQANSGIQRQIQAHLDEQRDLNTCINEAGTEIEIIQIEKHHLSRAWNDTITVVKARDEALRAARETLQQSKEELRNRESELRSLIRGIHKEQERHEEKTILLKRRRMEERIADAQLKSLEGHTQKLKDQLVELHAVKHQVEQDYLKAVNLLSRKEREVHHPRRKLELLSSEKARLEDKILFHMQEHDAVDKVTAGMAKKIHLAREKTRAVEAEVAKVENDMTNLTITVERLRTELLKKTTGLDELDKKLKSQEKVLHAQAQDMKNSERMIQKKTTEIENMNRKLKKLIAEHGGIEVGPLEKEIDELEKQIGAHRSLCVDLQEQWLKLQSDLVHLTGKRDEILAENELIRKEAFIMERKKQRLDAEVETKRLATEKMKKQIELLQAEIQAFNAKLYAGKAEESQMDKDNILIQNEFISLLKDAETEAVELQQEIANLEEEKDVLTATLTEGHEKCLWWEKKVKLAKELRESIKQEQENSTSALKLAIHHMQVRYNELQRVQEKLSGDLERCIDRREQIIAEADHDIKRANVDPKRTKLNIQRNRESIEEKNRQVLREATEAEKEIKEMQAKIGGLDGKLKCEMEALRRIREMIAVAEEKIADATVEKHKDMIELFLRQQKYKLLESISMNRYKPHHTQDEIENLCQESEELCYELVELCEILLHQYPDLALPIKLVKASIFTSTQTQK